MARQVPIGGALGTLVSFAYAYLAQKIQESGIRHLANQRNPELEAVPFMAVYSPNEEIATQARNTVNWNPATSPTDSFVFWQIENASLSTKEPDFQKAGDYEVGGVIVLRHPIFNGPPIMLRLRITVIVEVAPNGNPNWLQPEIREISKTDFDSLMAETVGQGAK